VRVALIGTAPADYCLELANILAEHCEVLLCMSDRYTGMTELQRAPNLEIAWFAVPRHRQLKSIHYLLKLRQTIKKWRPNLVHFLMENHVWLNLLPSLLDPLPIVTTVHDIEHHPGDHSSRRIPRFLINTLIRQSNCIIVHGPRLREGLLKQQDSLSDRVFIVPHPPITYHAELAKRSGYGKPRDGLFRVLFFGRIYEYKGLRYLLEAAPLISAAAPQVRFIIAGTGADFGQYSSMIQDHANFEIHNSFIPDEEVARFFAEADLLALPYIEGSQSGVLANAIGFGLPVVTTDVGELAGVVRETGMGLIVPPADGNALAEAISDIAQDASLYDKLAANAHLVALHNYAKRTILTRTLSAYDTSIQQCTHHARSRFWRQGVSETTASNGKAEVRGEAKPE
jgi:glycosyltransferase involved in cell wall biosynthesis